MRIDNAKELLKKIPNWERSTIFATYTENGWIGKALRFRDIKGDLPTETISVGYFNRRCSCYLPTIAAVAATEGCSLKSDWLLESEGE